MTRYFQVALLAILLAPVVCGQGRSSRPRPSPPPRPSPEAPSCDTAVGAELDRNAVLVSVRPLDGLDLAELPKELVKAILERHPDAGAYQSAAQVGLYVNPSSLKTVAGVRGFETGTQIQLYAKSIVPVPTGLACLVTAVPRKGTQTLGELLGKDVDYYIRRLQLIEFVGVPRVTGSGSLPETPSDAGCGCAGDSYCVSTLSVVPRFVLNEPPDAGSAPLVRLPTITALRKEALQLEAADADAVTFLNEVEWRSRVNASRSSQPASANEPGRTSNQACVSTLDLKAAAGDEQNLLRRAVAWHGFWKKVAGGREKLDAAERELGKHLPGSVTAAGGADKK